MTRQRAILRVINVIVAVAFSWTNCVWASGMDVLSAQNLAVGTRVDEVAGTLGFHPAGTGFFRGEAVLKQLGIDSIKDVVKNMSALTEEGVRCLVYKDMEGNIAKYIIEDGALLRKTPADKEVKDAFYRILQSLGIEGTSETVEGETREYIYVTKENVGFINSVLQILSNNNPEWVVKVEREGGVSNNIRQLVSGDEVFPDDNIIERINAKVAEGEKGGVKYDFLKKVKRNKKGEFVVQFNSERKGKRPSQYDPKRGVYQPYNPRAPFNFSYYPNGDIPLPGKIAGVDVSLYFNPRPFSEGHFIICPKTRMCYPQYLDKKEFIDVAIAIVNSSRKDNLKVTFNSMGAFGSINNLHFQGFYYGEGNTVWEERQLPVEKAGRKLVFDIDDITVSQITDYPAHGLTFKGNNKEKLSKFVFWYVKILREQNIPHNILFTRGEIIVFPRKFEFPNKFGAGTAVLEMSGEFIVFDEKTYDTINEDGIRQELAETTIGEDEFSKTQREFQSLIQKIGSNVQLLDRIVLEDYTEIGDGVDLTSAIAEGRGALDENGIFYLIKKDAKGVDIKGRDLESGTIVYIENGELVIDDYFEIVDENGSLTGERLAGTKAHEQGKWHRNSNIVLLTQKGEIVLQKRAPAKRAFPGYYSIHGGHVTWGADYESTALTELEEEVRYKDEIVIKWDPKRLNIVNISPYDSTSNPKDTNPKPNREWRALYVYVLTPDEEKHVREIAGRLEEDSGTTTIAEDTKSEVTRLEFVDLNEFIEQVKEFDSLMEKEDFKTELNTYQGKKFTPDLVLPIFTNEQIVSSIKSILTVGEDLKEYLPGGFKRGKYMIVDEYTPDTAGEAANFNFRFHAGFTFRDIFIRSEPVVENGKVVFKVSGVSDNWLKELKEKVVVDKNTEDEYNREVGELFLSPELTEEELYAGIIRLRKKHFGENAGILDGGKAVKFEELEERVARYNRNTIGSNLFSLIEGENDWANRIKIANISELTNDPVQIRKMMEESPAVDDSGDFATAITDTAKPVHYVHFAGSASSIAVDLKVFGDLLIKKWMKDGKGLDDLAKEGYKVSFVVKKERMVSNYKDDSNLLSTVEVTEDDIKELLKGPEFGGLKEARDKGLFEVVVSGTDGIGTDLRQASPELVNLLMEIKGYQSDPNSKIRGVVGLKGEENNITVNLIDVEHYRLFLARYTKTQFATGYMDRNVPRQVILRVPAGIEIFKELCPKRLRRLTVRQYVEAREVLRKEGITEDRFRESMLKRRAEAGIYLTLVEALCPEVLIDEALRGRVKRDGLNGIIDKDDPYLAIIKENRRLKEKFCKDISQGLGGDYSTHTAYLYPVKDNNQEPKVTEQKEDGSIGQVNCSVFTLPLNKLQEFGGLIPEFASSFGKEELIAPGTVAEVRGYRNSVVISGLYFWTGSLNNAYNACRKHRPWEKVERAGYYVGGKIENGEVTSVPSYKKGYVARTKDGRLIFGTWRLGAGEIMLSNGAKIGWEAQQVNPTGKYEVEIYTPLHYDNLVKGKGSGTCVLVRDKREEELGDIEKEAPEPGTKFDQNRFEIKVGAGRYNLIIIGNRIEHIIYGDVFIPCTGFVISLDEGGFNRLLGGIVKVKKVKDEIGEKRIYKFKKGIKPEVDFGLTLPEELKDVEWCLEGGALLVNNGQPLNSYTELVEVLTNQGWFNPLSMKTQETSVEKIWIQPRMAIGITENNKFFAIAYDGRQVDTLGANLGEMVRIAEQKLGEVRYLLNLDSGASVSLNFIDDNSNLVTVNTTTEVPSTNPKVATTTGQLREINSMFVVRKTDEKETIDPSKSSPLSKKMDSNKHEVIYSKVEIDTFGNIVGIEELVDGERVDKKAIQGMIDYIKGLYGEGVLGSVREIVIVDNLGGIDSEIPEEQKGGAAYFVGEKMVVDRDVFKHPVAKNDVGVHEALEATLRLVESNPGIQEVTATYCALEELLELKPEDLDSYIEFLKQPDNGLDSMDYAGLLEAIRERKDRLTREDLIGLAIGCVLNTPRYSHLKDSLAGVLPGEIEKAKEKLELARNIYRDIVQAKKEVMEELKGSVGPVINQARIAKAKMKVRMIVSSLPVKTIGFVDALVKNNKYILLDRDELTKPENKYIMDWINRITEGKERSPFIFSDEEIPDGVKAEDVIYLIEPERVNEQLGQDRLYLPLPYSVSSIYLASQVVLAGGKVSGITDKLVLNTIRTLYETLLGRDITETELEQLFRMPWTVLPPIVQISAALETLRKAIIQIEVAA